MRLKSARVRALEFGWHWTHLDAVHLQCRDELSFQLGHPPPVSAKHDLGSGGRHNRRQQLKLSGFEDATGVAAYDTVDIKKNESGAADGC